jgi:tRNA threonylcarbamoyladenosine biosynthesis protein TsaB
LSSRLLLALETACGGPAVVLLRGDEVLAEASGPPGSRGAEHLLPCIDRVLGEAGIPLADIEAFAVSIGPGSFTGLRVGVATLKGLAFGDDRPVAAVPTLQAVAFAAGDGTRAIVAVLDAQRDEFYVSGFDPSDAAGPLVACAPFEGVYRPEQLAPLLPEGCALAGPGAALCAEALGRAAPPIVIGQVPLAAAVGRLGQIQVAAGDFVSSAGLVPRYLRRAEAEVKRTGQRFE